MRYSRVLKGFSRRSRRALSIGCAGVRLCRARVRRMGQCQKVTKRAPLNIHCLHRAPWLSARSRAPARRPPARAGGAQVHRQARRGGGGDPPVPLGHGGVLRGHGRGGAGGRESVWLVCAQVVQRTNSGSHYGHMPIMPLPQVGAPSWPCGIVRCVPCACMRPGDMPCRPCRRLRVPPARLSRFTTAVTRSVRRTKCRGRNG